ncbi:MAG: hypothetical protein M1296_02040 [Chloroflexi bacterium]|nr:hypothetical protein [Chloroflexota bacterium]
MAHIYIGNKSQVDPEVLGVVSTLNDEYWAFAEFNAAGRNVDWFIAKASTDEPSVLIMTELKRMSRPLRGAFDGVWERQDDDGKWEEIIPANSSDRNYYWQAVNATNALAQWLWNNQARFLHDHSIDKPLDFRIWPDLLLLGPESVQHRLPYRPDSGFGMWFQSLEKWIQHVRAWRPRHGVTLSFGELESLAEALDLERCESPVFTSDPPKTGPAPASIEIEGFFDWLLQLDQRVANLERELAQQQRHPAADRSKD